MGEREGEKKRNKALFGCALVVWAVFLVFHIVFNHRTELVSVLFGFLFYQFANYCLRFYFYYYHYSSRGADRSILINTSVSLLHSSFTSASVVFIIVNQLVKNGAYDIFEHSQLFGGTWAWAYKALCYSCGYFAYDQLDMLRYRLYSGLVPSILVHHLVLLVCFTLALCRNVTINYLILTLICELHSVFLHVRKIRRMAGVRDAKSKSVKVEWIFNWVMFLIARLISHVLITIKLIKDASKFGKGIELPLALFGMACMNLLNLFLGVDLFQSFRKETELNTNHSE